MSRSDREYEAESFFLHAKECVREAKIAMKNEMPIMAQVHKRNAVQALARAIALGSNKQLQKFRKLKGTV